MRREIVVGMLLAAHLGLVTLPTMAHPGSGIVVDAEGNVLLGDINRGLLKMDTNGKVTRIQNEAGHWLALDTAGRFSRMEFEKSDHWPRWFKRRSAAGTV